MKHKDKLKMARKMLTQEEIKVHVSPFRSAAWNKRQEEVANSVHNREVLAKNYSESRKNDQTTQIT